VKKRICLVSLALLLAISVVVVGCPRPVDPVEEFPVRPITFLIGFGAGGGTDLFARAIGESLRDLFGWTIVYVNKPGGAGSLAENHLAGEPADGYLVLAMGSDITINMLARRTPHDLDHFVPIARVQQDTSMIFIRTDDPRFANLDEFVAYAKENPVTIAGTGAGGIDEVITALFVEKSGINAVYVPYDAAGVMAAALLGGEIDAMHEELGPVIGLVEAGDIKPIVAMTEERIDEFPWLPTTVEMGWDITLGRWRGFVVRAGVPEEIIQMLETSIEAAFQTESYRIYERASYLHLRPGWLSGEDFRKLLEAELEMFRKVLTDLGLL